MVDKKLKADLLKEFEIQQPALSKRADKIKKVLMMPTDIAVYIIAHEAGLKLKKYLDDEKINEVMVMQNKWATITGSQNLSVKTGNKSKVAREKQLIFPSGFSYDDPLMPSNIKNESLEMAKVYPYLYVLENSIRSFIIAAMIKYHGPNWWEEKVSRYVKDRVKGLKTKENKNLWHQRISDRDIDYVNFEDLKRLINKVKQNLAKDQIIPQAEWINNLIDEIYTSRCVVAHMNPLSKDNIDMVKLKTRQWARLIKEKHKELI